MRAAALGAARCGIATFAAPTHTPHDQTPPVETDSADNDQWSMNPHQGGGSDNDGRGNNYNSDAVAIDAEIAQREAQVAALRARALAAAQHSLASKNRQLHTLRAEVSSQVRWYQNCARRHAQRRDPACLRFKK